MLYPGQGPYIVFFVMNPMGTFTHKLQIRDKIRSRNPKLQQIRNRHHHYPSENCLSQGFSAAPWPVHVAHIGAVKDLSACFQ